MLNPLSPAEQNELLQDYISTHSMPEPEALRQINRTTWLTQAYPHMLSGHIQGRLLAMLSRMIRPARILELGTFVGYSALCLAEGLQDGGTLVSVEKNDELEQTIRSNWSLSPLGARCTLRLGAVLEVADEMRRQGEAPFDLVFLDSDKREYTEDLEAVLPLVKDGGWILADNTLWDGHIIDPAYDKDRQTQGLRRFNDYVQQHPLLDNVILPVRDGLTIIRKTGSLPL